jgi:hypothetical protein
MGLVRTHEAKALFNPLFSSAIKSHVTHQLRWNPVAQFEDGVVDPKYHRHMGTESTSRWPDETRGSKFKGGARNKARSANEYQSHIRYVYFRDLTSDWWIYIIKG